MKEVKAFTFGILFTLFIGMATWITFDMNKIVAHYKQADHMKELVALSLEDLK